MTTDDAVVEAVVRAVCPLVKPWMDEAEDLVYDSCDCAEHVVIEGHGDCVTACRVVMEDVANAAILAYRQAMRERGVVEYTSEFIEALREWRTSLKRDGWCQADLDDIGRPGIGRLLRACDSAMLSAVESEGTDGKGE